MLKRKDEERLVGPLQPILPGDVILDQMTWLSALRLFRCGETQIEYKEYPPFLQSDVLSLMHLLEALVCYERIYLVGASQVWGGRYLESRGMRTNIDLLVTWHPLQYVPFEVIKYVLPLPMGRKDYLDVVQQVAQETVQGKYDPQIKQFMIHLNDPNSKLPSLLEIARVPDSPDKRLMNEDILATFGIRFPEHGEIFPLLAT
jgi:hypothetical protein